MATIPTDIILSHILPKLPADSLIIFKSVCKSWQIYISSQKFISLHLNNISLSSNNNHHDLLILTSSIHHFLYLLHFNTPQIPTHKLPFPISPDFIIGSCNGLLCVNLCSKQGLIIILNPCTGIARKIPALRLPRRPRSVNYGFGYDSVMDDYKVIRVLDYYPNRISLFREVSRQISVFSLRGDDKWRVVEWVVTDDQMRHGDNGAVIDYNLVHWKVWDFVERKYRIRCFDLCQEKWIVDVGLPGCDGESVSEMVFNDLLYEDSDADKRDEVLDLGVFDGCLFLSRKCVEQQMLDSIGENVAGFDLWVLKEYGVKESWIKLFRISDVKVMGSLRMAPVVYGRGNSEILFKRDFKSEQKLFWYNVKNETVEIAQFDDAGECIWADLCIGSLVSVPGGHPFEMANLA